MKILVVEDDAAKRRNIAEVLEGVEGINVTTDMWHAGDMASALRELKERYFDLLILDIVLPMRADQEAEREGGFRLLEAVLERPGYNVPSHVVGLTAYRDVVEAGSERFEQRLLTLLYYDPASDNWRERLKARAAHILLAAERNDAPAQFDAKLVVVCALDTPELRHVLRLPWEWKATTLPGDHTLYYEGRLESEAGTQRVFAAAAARMGMPAMACLAMKAILAFRPEYIAMPGIAAAVRGRANVGDVLVADPSWDWGNGKRIMGTDGSTLQPAPHQLPLAGSIRSLIRNVASDAALLSEIRHAWPDEPPDTELTVRLGPVASGAAVLGDGVTSESIVLQHRETIGIDMEIYGLFAAAADAPSPQPKPFALKAAVDFADGAKTDRFQNYGAFVSAQLLRVLAERYL